MIKAEVTRNITGYRDEAYAIDDSKECEEFLKTRFGYKVQPEDFEKWYVCDRVLYRTLSDREFRKFYTINSIHVL